MGDGANMRVSHSNAHDGEDIVSQDRGRLRERPALSTRFEGCSTPSIFVYATSLPSHFQ